MLTAEHIHPTASTCKVKHLLPCDFARRQTNALTLYTMISPKQQMTRMGKRWRQGLLNHTNLHSKTLQSTKRTFWFVQIIYLVLYG